jgi:two-component system cell cycle response regulator DivK
LRYRIARQNGRTQAVGNLAFSGRGDMSVDILERPKAATVDVRQQVKILVIEDDEVMAHLLSRRLRQQGFETVWANSGETGLAIARSERPWLIILDLRLRDSDGLAVCEQLVDGPSTCGIPVIVLGGLDVPDAVRRSRAAGCHFFLAKPCDPNVLLVLIRQAIADVWSWDELGD